MHEPIRAATEGRVSAARYGWGPGSPLALCDGQYSPRTVPAALGITADQERALADALACRSRVDQPAVVR